MQTCTKWHFSPFLQPCLDVLSVVAVADRLAIGSSAVALSRLRRLLLLVALILALAASPFATAFAIHVEGDLAVPGLRPLVA